MSKSRFANLRVHDIVRVGRGDTHGPFLGIVLHFNPVGQPYVTAFDGTVTKFLHAEEAQPVPDDQLTDGEFAQYARWRDQQQKPEDPVVRIQQLAAQFPTLANRSDVRLWDPESLDRWASTVASSGERWAVGFVLRVWNQTAPWATPFDVFQALQKWDDAHRAAFARWVQRPFIC